MANGIVLIPKAPEAQSSCRLDFLTLTYAHTSKEDQDEFFDYLCELADALVPGAPWRGPTKAKHFEQAFSHPSGISFEVTSIDSHLSTAGRSSAGWSGTALGLLDAKERSDLYVDCACMNGFKRCTRLDPQVTVLDPEKTVEEVVSDVSQGRLWAARFGTQNAYGSMNQDGEWRSPPTQYFGSKEGNVRLRIYDHGAKHEWEQRSLRVEAQLRKQTADDHFRRLVQRCKPERDTPPILIKEEERTVKDALAQHADLRDTSKWAGRPRPRKWRQEAPVAGWWRRMLDHEPDPLQLTHRLAVEFERSRDVGCEQYGRKMALSVMFRSAMHEAGGPQELGVLYAQMCSYLKPEDFKLLEAALPEGAADKAKELWAESRRLGQEWLGETSPK